MRKRMTISILTIAILAMVIALPTMYNVSAVAPAPLLLDPKIIPKYVNQLSDASGNPLPPPVYVPEYSNATHEFYTVDVTQFTQQILPSIPGIGLLPTTVWGYGGMTASGYSRSAPGATFEATRNKQIFVRYQNKLTSLSHLFAVDPTLHWANPNNISMITAMQQAMMVPSFAPPYPPGYNGAPYLNPLTGVLTNPDSWNAQSPVPIIPHLHGGEVQSTSDGHPEAWFTPGGGVFQHGNAYNTELTYWINTTTGLLDPNIPIQTNEVAFRYPNEQPPTTLWYHDHALGITRINVMSGLAGFYLLRDPADTIASTYLPPIQYEMPLVVQDRTFDINGQFYFPSVGINPDHPYWLPEFFGNTIMVNGLVWPNMNVKQGVYRLRLLDGSNARFYTISFWIPNAKQLGIKNKLPFTIIGSDGGYLPAPVTVTELTIAPGERWDILVDFSTVPIVPGVVSNIILQNTAKAPFPKGAAADPQTTGQLMQFTVLGTPGWKPTQPLPPTLNTIPTLPAPVRQRQLTLIEIMGMGGPLEILLDGKKWAADISEKVTLGSTEEWIIVNPTADAHPIHLHLVQFQLVSRQAFSSSQYLADWWMLNPTAPIKMGDPVQTITNPPYTNYLQGKPVAPLPYEKGWKDTIQVFPGQVTIIRVRWAPIGGGSYPFDATVGPGYVWHCHILDHEDNEMMRPYLVVPAAP